jgi:hypothetical protein
VNAATFIQLSPTSQRSLIKEKNKTLEAAYHKLTARTKLNTKMQNSKMGIPLVLFGKEREIRFGHLVPRPGNNSEQLTRVFF